MAGRDQLTNDPQEAMRAVQQGLQASMWTCLPAFITKINLAQMTIEAQPTIQGRVTNEDGSQEFVDLPLLGDVPICFPRGGGFSMTFPMKIGDEVLIIFASRCIDAWWQSGGIQQPIETRMHDLSDGFAVLGNTSQPNVISDISSDDLEIRNDDGTVYLSLGADGKIGFKNATTDLKTVLTDFQTAVNAFMTTLAAFGGGGAAVTQAMLQAPATAAQAALAPVLVKIGALLK